MSAIHVARRVGARYTASMETPVLTAALARKPRRYPRAIPGAQGRGESKTRPHNYIAETPKKRAGAIATPPPARPSVWTGIAAWRPLSSRHARWPTL
jgi:hypothetical protein